MLLTEVRFVGPPAAFYDVALGAAAAFYIAIAIELDAALRRRDPEVVLEPRSWTDIRGDPKQRLLVIGRTLFAIVLSAISVLGFVTGIVALYRGGTRVLGFLTLAGLTDTFCIVVFLTVGLLFHLLGESIPWSNRWKIRAQVIIPALLVAGLLGVEIYALTATNG